MLYFFISLFASIVGAISGIGGGVIIKPVLDSISSFGVGTISFLSGCTVLSMTSVTLFKNRRSEIVLNKRVATLLALGSVVGGMAGKHIFDIIQSGSQDRVVAMTQSAILGLLTLWVLFFTIYKEKIETRYVSGTASIFFIGFVLGSISSFLGIGGGPINLAILYLLFSMDSKTAALNSIYIIFFSQLTSFLFTFLTGNVPPFDYITLSLMMIGGICGGISGSYLSSKMNNRAVDRLFMLVMVLIITICSYNFLKLV